MTTTDQGLAEEADIAATTDVVAKRIGLIADDHNGEEDGSDLPEEVLAAFDGVELILHIGHMGVKDKVAGRGVLDRLGTVAPVLAVRDYSTDSTGASFVTPADLPRVAGVTRVVRANGVRVGLVHNLAQPPGPGIDAPPGGLPAFDGIALTEALTEKFGGPVDVVAYAGTHRAAAVMAQGVLFVNPGSPTYPKGPGRQAGQRTLAGDQT